MIEDKTENIIHPGSELHWAMMAQSRVIPFPLNNLIRELCPCGFDVAVWRKDTPQGKGKRNGCDFTGRSERDGKDDGYNE
ncbi:hypothetical protein AVEN_81458-1 [Araneus ventricosus]|uniref:Uncharacterized protein n=1 Tax=Araneus ventricosus TaxID=182803 RepID=A0A4Y2W9Z0_ARAVE|nr:hypothetical protein AVEN_231679-1 [Araneus ventricosus]GBO33286.1 hypothetical protein AVEN_37011-1 [Araneus ventricosus]GBO34160.1 hypothetical protein AVEN_20413-1 [Araneus ventricosus]GBO34215.1 hypothetical protein AVEN_81458-1 [Araneus ventricosus]